MGSLGCVSYYVQFSSDPYSNLQVRGELCDKLIFFLILGKEISWDRVSHRQIGLNLELLITLVVLIVNGTQHLPLRLKTEQSQLSEVETEWLLFS